MQRDPTTHIAFPEEARFIDRLLRLRPLLNQRYEAETGAERSANLRETFYVGLVLFNAHNLTNIVLMPDALWAAMALRLLVVTPVVLLAAAYFEKMSAVFRERACLFLITSAFIIEAILFSITRAELGRYVFNEFTLTLVYGNMLLPLRFRHAIVFTAISFALTVVVLWCNPLLDDALRFAFVTQIIIACIITLYANYKTEHRRCRDYVVTHHAVLRAEQADSAKREFQDQSRTDALTGLPNRRVLDERLEEWFAGDGPAAVMMIDIDHFKLFNDTLGHPAGDDCLKRIGIVLAAAAEDPNVLCARFGGEEFAVVLQSADEVGAARMANSVVRAIEALGIAHPACSDGFGVVTASVGVTFRPAGFTAKPIDVIAAADRALYRAKRKGRNGYVIGNVNDVVLAHAFEMAQGRVPAVAAV